jgi:hypothetical protein
MVLSFLHWEAYEPVFCQAVRLGKWRAVHLTRTSPLELYDLKDDVSENTTPPIQILRSLRRLKLISALLAPTDNHSTALVQTRIPVNLLQCLRRY